MKRIGIAVLYAVLFGVAFCACSVLAHAGDLETAQAALALASTQPRACDCVETGVCSCGAACECVQPTAEPDTAAQIAALEARVAKLEAHIAMEKRAATVQAPVAAAPYYNDQDYQYLSALYSGSGSCANGSCGSSGRRGIFGRRR